MNIDKQLLYSGFVKKGDEAFAASDYEKTIAFYQMALDTGLVRDAGIYIKYGNAYDRKNNKQAAAMYLKALSFDFYNEHVHTLLISFYDKHNRLNDLKKWYEKNKVMADAEFINKEIKVINNIIDFRQNAAVEPSAVDLARQKQIEGILYKAGGWFKDYIMMNIVFGITFVLMGIGIAAGLILKLDLKIIFAIIGLFFMISIVVVVYIKQKQIRNKRKDRVMLEDIFKEFKNSPK